MIKIKNIKQNFKKINVEEFLTIWYIESTHFCGPYILKKN